MSSGVVGQVGFFRSLRKVKVFGGGAGAQASDLLKEKSTPSYVYVQEGGSVSELYLHEYETKMDALAGRVNCASDGAYKTGEIVEISPCLRRLGNVFFATAEALVGTVPGLSLYGDGEVGGI